MAKELTDDELNLRRKARRRLIGAIALTLAVVVILPMVLESQPKPSGQDIELRIPAPDKVGEFVPGVVVSGVAVAPLQAESAVAASAPVLAEVPAVEPAPAVAEPKVDVAKAQPLADKAPEPKTTTTPSPVAAKSANKSAASYAAQVGAFSSVATAKQEVDKLKKWGFSKAYTEKIGDKIRVRVGPYDERDKADKVRQLIEKHGMHPVVVSIK